MLVKEDGSVVGSVGGGYGEAKIVQQAIDAISSLKKSYKCLVNLSSDSEEEERIMCCGIMEVFIEVLQTDRVDSKKLYKSYLEKVRSIEEPVLATVINTPENMAEHLGDKLILTQKGGTIGSLPVSFLLISLQKGFGRIIRPQVSVSVLKAK